MKPQTSGARAFVSSSCKTAQRALPSPSGTLTRLLLVPNPQTVCVTCRNTLLRRQYSAAAAPQSAGQASEPSPLSSDSPSIIDTRSETRPQYQLRAGVVLSRPPIITRDLHPFEEAFFFYQRRLNERTAMPFSRYFYIKRGTPADVEWKRKIKERLTPARDIGAYNAYSKEGWNDEVLVGTKESARQHQMEALLRDAEEVGTSADAVSSASTEASGAGSKMLVERPQSRVSEADTEGDEQSLNRMLQRTLYLLVKNEQGKWEFPSSRLVGREGLNKAAERIIFETGGPDMNTWVVGHVPIGHFARDFSAPITNKDNKTVELGQKTFFLKARIMAGQANLNATTLGFQEFKWLAKEEIQKLVTPRYWSYAQDMLAER